MEEAVKTLVGVSGLFASISIAPIHEVIALLLATASLIYMVINIIDKLIKMKNGQ